MSYILGTHSLNELKGVHPELVKIVKDAIKITKQDFIVFDGLRTEAEQRKYVLKGVSKTNRSFHLYGLAVDLVPWVHGKPTWEEKYFKEIAIAMKTAIEGSIFKIEWGYDKWGWDLPHWQITTLNGKDARLVYDARKGGYIK